ncbi:MAG TPA: flagellar hook protein FlgE [Roseomonas sp.]
MSLFGSMTTAISGLTAQSRALGNISDNVANSQTVGYKRVDTNFVSYITDSTARQNLPGSVQARPDYRNSLQGTPVPSDNPLAMAVAGQGFFAVSRPVGNANGSLQFDERQFYTRAGDFSVDENGYMVNGSGYYLQGWASDATGQPDRTQVQPIRINEMVFNPIASSKIDLSANLPADAAANSSPIVTPVNVYDSLGTLQPMTLTWSPLTTGTPPAVVPNQWTVNINAPNGGGSLGSAVVRFGNAATPPVAAGTIGQIIPTAPATAVGTGALGDPAGLGLTADFGQGPQAISLNLGTIGSAAGLTQYSGEEFELRNLEPDGVPLGSYSGVSIQDNGDVAINYDNGQTRVVYRVPLTNFNDPDSLQRMDGQAFMRTIESGEARVSDVASNGTGRLAVGSVEGSNVDIASEFSKLIVAQRAYTANTRIVTTTDEMLQDTINMRR